MIVRRAAAEARYSTSKMGKATLCSGNQLFAGLNCFLPGQTHELHTHKGQDKLYFVLEGCATVTVGGVTETVEAGDLILARAGEPHGVSNSGPDNLVILTMMAPPPAPKPKKET